MLLLRVSIIQLLSILVFLMLDGSFDPEYLDQMLEKNKSNFEFVFSTRYKTWWK